MARVFVPWLAFLWLAACSSDDSDSLTKDAGTHSNADATVDVVPDSQSGKDSAPKPPDCEDLGSAAPSSAWVNATGNLAGMASECGNLTLVSAVPCTSRVIAGVAQKGLWESDDAGKTWVQLGTGAGSAPITNRPSSIVYDPTHPGLFWESGIYNGPGAYVTTDSGTTFTQLGDITHADLVSVDFTDPTRKTLLVGGHEQKQVLHRSTNGGQSWTNVGANLPNTTHFSSLPLVIDSTTHLVGACGWGDGDCGIWRTTNGGESWERVSELPVQAAPLWASDGRIYWPLGGSGIAVSSDQGETWSTATSQGVSGAPIELPDGRLVAVAGDHLQISSNQAKNWTPIGDVLPFAPSGVTYSALSKTFFVWHWDCGSNVLPDAIMSAGF
jgi:hypothetical protein